MCQIFLKNSLLVPILRNASSINLEWDPVNLMISLSWEPLIHKIKSKHTCTYQGLHHLGLSKFIVWSHSLLLHAVSLLPVMLNHLHFFHVWNVPFLAYMIFKCCSSTMESCSFTLSSSKLLCFFSSTTAFYPKHSWVTTGG